MKTNSERPGIFGGASSGRRYVSNLRVWDVPGTPLTASQLVLKQWVGDSARSRAISGTDSLEVPIAYV